jgi:DNA-binding GntR family transcriptional regulator
MSLNYRSKNQAVYETLRDAIVAGEFVPGQRIVIDELAAQLGVSHSPIRECLRQLEADGFVTIRPYAGVTVTEIQPESIKEVFELLEALEIISSRGACQRASDEQIAELERFITDMANYTTQPEAWSEKNIALHMLICDIAATQLTHHMMNRALHHWDRLRRYYLEDVSAQRIGQAHQEHLDILAAIRNRDEVKVVQTIHSHNEYALKAYLAHINQTHEIDLNV